MAEQSLPIEYYINVSITSDKLLAILQFANVDETFTCTMEQLEALLRNNKIVYGIDRDVLRQIAANPTRFMNGKTIVARGTEPRHGIDGSLELLCDLDTRDNRPREQEDGSVNYKEVRSINNVRKGQPIARRIPPEPGLDGTAVTGEVIQARPGREVRFKMGKNVVTDGEQTTLYAAIDGVIVQTDNGKLNVFPVYEVNGDVDYNIGNIDFVGTVVIRGNVLPGFQVKAEGDIRVTGGVEAAILIAGGSIEIGAGILGQNKGLVKAGKTVKSSFIQEGIVEAGEDVLATQSILHSTIRAGRNVICQGTKGLIVGGTIQAGERVTARTIGNSLSTNTVIEVGVLPQLRNELIELRQLIKNLTEQLDKTIKALALLDQMAANGQLSSDKLAMRIKLAHTRKKSEEELAHMKERVLEIEKSLEDTELAKVSVHSTVYSGTKIVIGRYTRFIKDSCSRVTFRIDEGDIVMVPL